METLLTSLIKTVVLPPGLIIFGVLAGYIFKLRYPKVGRSLILVSLMLGLLFTLPIVSSSLALVTETYPPIAPNQIQHLRADAIVILAGGKDSGRQEYGGVTVSKATLERIRYGAVLHRQLKLPVLVTGGVVLGDGVAEAALMAEVLQKEFFITPHWVETKSRNTAQNALFSAQMLPAKNVILVTNALHMRRSVSVFERAGFNVTAAPVASVGPRRGISIFIQTFSSVRKILGSFTRCITRMAWHVVVRDSILDVIIVLSERMKGVFGEFND